MFIGTSQRIFQWVVEDGVCGSRGMQQHDEITEMLGNQTQKETCVCVAVILGRAVPKTWGEFCVHGVPEPKHFVTMGRSARQLPIVARFELSPCLLQAQCKDKPGASFSPGC